MNYNGKIFDSYASGNIIITSEIEAAVGGFVGLNFCLSNGYQLLGYVYNCFATGNIEAYTDKGFISVGGFVGGWFFDVIYNCYCYDGQELYIYDYSGGCTSVSGAAGTQYGLSHFAAQGLFTSGSTGGNSVTAVIGECTAEQLSSDDFYVSDLGWDTNIWDFSTLDFNCGYLPILLWQTI